MKRVLIGVLLASSVGLALASCDNGSWGTVSYGSGGSGGYCSANTSCGTCTPVDGCGWCAAPNGTGVCAPDPDDCPTLEFTWTWDPNGCRVVAEASIEEPDGSSGDSSIHSTDGASTGDSAPDAASSESSTKVTCNGQGDAAMADAPNCD
jgi:hypothetical protein